MSLIWSEEAQLETWLDIEVFACEAWGKLGKIPKKSVENIQKNAKFDIKKFKELEKETKHDLAAFVSEVQSYLGEDGKYVHLGLTSSDIVDTSFAYRLKKSSEILLADLDALISLTKEKAKKYKDTPMIGRTHGIHAEPTTMGLKFLLWHDLLKRSKARLEFATKEISVGKLSGAVGTYAHAPQEVESYVCKKLGLEVDTLSTQVISRDRFAQYFSALALIGAAVESIVTEIRHLQRTEVSEVREGFSKGQKGSSAMPHKRNPIASENLTGIARLLRGMLIPAIENCALWHERDISHSSVERVIGPDANILADYMLGRLQDILANLEIFPKKMVQNLELLQGVIYSQKILIALIDKGLSRDAAYKLVQKNAHEALDTNTPFIEILSKDKEVSKIISKKELSVIMNPNQYLNQLDYLFEKVL
jgi:adenylosuccinate lyase